MSKFFDWLGKNCPPVWGVMWVLIITLFSLGALIAGLKWVLTLLGVLA